jgi:hypothetical protein
MKQEASILLRLSLAFAFSYAAISELMSPDAWLAFFPSWLGQVWPLRDWLVVFAIAEILLAVWIMSGEKLFWAGLIAAAILLAITLSNLFAMDIVFRDLSLCLAAMALAVLNKETKVR